MSLCASVVLYQESCAIYGTKPNKDIISQIEHPAFLQLKTIDASRTFLGSFGVKAILNFVSQHAGIERLILVKNGVDTSCLEHMCTLLRNGSIYLSFIDLSENPLSTPSVRMIWETVKDVPTVHTVKLSDCGVSDEWLRRVERCCKANDALERFGFFPYGPERSLHAWEIVFVLVLGCPSAVERYCKEIIPPVNSFVAKLRLRIAPLTVDEDDSAEMVKHKIQQCTEQRNYNLSWCVVLFVSEEKWSGSSLTALELMAQQKSPPMPPLRDKQGLLRDPVQKCAQHLFAYDMTPFNQQAGGATWTTKTDIWQRVIGEDALSETKDIPLAVPLLSDSSFYVRCQSDLFTALNTVFAEPPRPAMSLSDDEESEMEKFLWETMEQERPMGSFFPKCKDVQQYVDSPPGSLSVPLLLYGAGGVGKHFILSWIATTYRTAESLRVVPYRLTYDRRSLVVMLLYLLRIFDKNNMELFFTVEELAMAVQKAIREYKGVTILLLVTCLESLESLGTRQSMIVEWLPPSLPSSVKVIVTLNTESPYLSYFRKRQPQPYEILIIPSPAHFKVAMFVEELNKRSVVLSSEQEGSASGASCSGELEVSYKTLESAFFQKAGFEFIHFPKYTAAFIHHLIPANASEDDVASLIAENIPDSLQDLLVVLLRRYEFLHGVESVQYILLSLAAAPLPLNELIYICEDIGPCRRSHTVQLALLMSEDGVLNISADSVLYLANTNVRKAVISSYAEAWDSVSVLVETHLHRLVMTQSPDMSICFQKLLPLMMENGNFAVAASMVLNAKIMDELLGRKKENRIYVVDALFRLLNIPQVLSELDENASSLNKEYSFPSHTTVRYALRSVQSYNSFFFQEVLLMNDLSPYYTDASSATEVPHTVLVPLNRGDEESALYSLQCKNKPLFLHAKGEYTAVTTPQDVTVYLASENYKAINSMSFDVNQELLGAVLATGGRVVVISREQIVLWDFTGHSFTLLPDMTAALSSNALNAAGASLVARQHSREVISIVDIVKKKTDRELSRLDGPVRECVFFGTSVLALSVYDLFLIKERNVIKLSHNGFIRCFSTSGDGQIIASSVKENLWLWSNSGELLHHIDAGPTPLEGLQFGLNGPLLLTLQSEGVKLWNCALGINLTTLDRCFNEDISFVCFSEDGSRIIGRHGTRFCSWDSHRPYKPQGAFTCSNGHFTFLQECNQTIFTITSKDKVSIWNYENTPFPSIFSARDSTVTTMWRKNAKLSSSYINCIDVNTAGSHFVVVDGAGMLMMVSVEEGNIQKLDASNVQSAVIIDDAIVFTTDDSENCMYFTGLNTKEHDLKSVKLPKNLQFEITLQLLKNEHGNKIAAIANGTNSSAIYTYDLLEESWTNQFLGHSGKITHVFFSGEFLTSSGKDCTLRLWSLVRHAERTSYLHPCQICAMTKTDHSESLFLFDESSRLYYVRVEDINSSTHARFVATEIEMSTVIPKGVKARHMTFVSHLIVMSSWDGSVYVVDSRSGGLVSRLPDYRCVNVTVSSVDSGTFVLTTHTTGEVILHNVLFGV